MNFEIPKKFLYIKLYIIFSLFLDFLIYYKFKGIALIVKQRKKH